MVIFQHGCYSCVVCFVARASCARSCFSTVAISGPAPDGRTASLPAKIIPTSTKIARPIISRKFSVDMRIPPLELMILLE